MEGALEEGWSGAVGGADGARSRGDEGVACNSGDGDGAKAGWEMTADGGETWTGIEGVGVVSWGEGTGKVANTGERTRSEGGERKGEAKGKTSSMKRT